MLTGLVVHLDVGKEGSGYITACTSLQGVLTFFKYNNIKNKHILSLNLL